MPTSPLTIRLLLATLQLAFETEYATNDQVPAIRYEYTARIFVVTEKGVFALNCEYITIHEQQTIFGQHEGLGYRTEYNTAENKHFDSQERAEAFFHTQQLKSLGNATRSLETLKSYKQSGGLRVEDVQALMRDR